MKHGDEEVLQLFIEESREHLSGIEEDLLAIEQGGENASEQIVDKVFRAIHTIKGSASFFCFTSVKNLSHAMENVLGKFRSRELVPTGPIVSVLLDGADALRSMVNDLTNSEKMDTSSFISKLESFLAGTVAVECSGLSKKDTPATQTGKTTLQFLTPAFKMPFIIDLEKIYQTQQLGNERFVFLLEILTETDILAKNRNETELLEEIELIAQIIDTKKLSADNSACKCLVVLCISSMDKDILVECLAMSPERVSQVLTGRIGKDAEGQCSLTGVIVKHLDDRPAAIPESKVSPAEEHPLPAIKHEEKPSTLHPVEKKAISPSQETSLRVSIHTLDKLMTLAGEMVLTRNELLQNASARNMQKILVASQRVDSITSELQEAIMSTRMQSIGVVFSKFRRVVRDLSTQLEKQILLEIDGEEVELDKSIVEAVGDPLTHLVRNAVDHGIETPEARLQAGKPPQGTLVIRACHAAGQVVIEIIDDGKGIDPSVIRKKARSMGFVDDTVLSGMSDRELINLIFKPGFSTVDKVTEISGRGVGMDVVQNNLKKVGGAVDIESVPGKGTTIRIKLPLTLAIIPCLLVIVEGKRYAIPQGNLVELVRISASDVKRKMEMVGDAAVIRLRGELLPLIRVSDVLGISHKTYTNSTSGETAVNRRNTIADRRGARESEGSEEKRQRGEDRRKSPASAVNVVVVAAGNFKYGLIVDSLLDSSEIVVKPLGYHLCDCREYAGATILGDGQVALILDVMGIRRLLEMKDNADAISEHMARQSETDVRQYDYQSFLIVKNGEGDCFAIPVGLISRIEKIKEDAIKTTGGKAVVQYRGGTLRLFFIDDIVNVKVRTKRTNVYALVFQIGGREAGIVISEIVDTVNIYGSDIDNITHVQPGIIGSTVVLDSITLILDIFGIVKTFAPELSKLASDSQKVECGKRILIVEDSVFFLQQIRSFIEDAGYETLCAEDGVKGLAVLKNSSVKIDLILTDIEMPHMNGLELTRAIRADQTLKDIPIIAVTSVTGEKAQKTGFEAGVDEYLIKLDREAVLAACKRYLSTQLKQGLTKELV
jgi:two-component system chemotaxis sensor kinase CheA